MSDEKKEARRTAEFLKSAPTHFKYWNDKQRQHAENEAAEFRAAFAEGKCSELENLLMKVRQDTARFCCGV